MQVPKSLSPMSLAPQLDTCFALAGEKIHRLARRWNPADGAPVITRNGIYTAQGWTEWTQGFQFGLGALHFEGTGDLASLEICRQATVRHMASHLSHMGVHDHGFNNLSTYGNLRRLALEGRFGATQEEIAFYELALKVSGAVQAARWTRIHDGTGFIHSFNGPHSLFVDTVRSVRSLVLADRLGQVLMGENDARISLLGRAVQHLVNTARYNIYYGAGRDTYDVRGRTAHEALFNTTDGQFRCPSSQQGYSPFSTWTRGLGWALLGFAEQLEYLATLDPEVLAPFAEKKALLRTLQHAAEATADFYLEHSALDGIPYWDTGAPGIAQLGDYTARPAEPDNPHEPVDSSAAAIAAQGLVRLGKHLGARGHGALYQRAGLAVARTLLQAPYLSTDPRHEGLLRHVVYHRPRGWDFVPHGKRVPQGESALWGDYHLLELAVYLRRSLSNDAAHTFYGPA